MLRNERVSRRITHPHLTYSTTGTLICLVCNIQIKTEALWNKHLNTPQHGANLQKASGKPDSQPPPPEEADRVNGSKKRKANDDNSDEDTRKRTRGEILPDKSLLSPQANPTRYMDDKPISNRKRKRSSSPINSDPTTNGIQPRPSPADAAHPTSQQPKSSSAIDEDEWAAFQRDVASPPPESSALTAAADISAAPMTAAELAAQSRLQASTQAKERMEAEIEGEKEDAARQMEEELEEMAELEDRVRRLREKREALRMREVEVDRVGQEEQARIAPTRVPESVDINDASASDDDDEIDEWGAWGR